VVLLLIAVMSVVAIRLVEQSSGAVALAAAQAREVVVRRAADGGVELFLHRATAGAPITDGWEEMAELGAARVHVRAESELRRVDLNVGALALIEGILRGAGHSPRDAARIAGLIDAERRAEPPRLFRAVDELLRVPGVDPTTLDAIRPFLTVFGASPGISVGIAPKTVLTAVPGITPAMAEAVIRARAGQGALPAAGRKVLSPYLSRGRPVFRVVSTATAVSGARFQRVAIVDLSLAGGPVILDWGQEVGTVPAVAGPQ
jgi:type II secretory pathway component PulK